MRPSREGLCWTWWSEDWRFTIDQCLRLKLAHLLVTEAGVLETLACREAGPLSPDRRDQLRHAPTCFVHLCAVNANAGTQSAAGLVRCLAFVCSWRVCLRTGTVQAQQLEPCRSVRCRQHQLFQSLMEIAEEAPGRQSHCSMKARNCLGGA